jgi:hypothetical protein
MKNKTFPIQSLAAVLRIRIRIWIRIRRIRMFWPPGSRFLYHQAKIVRKTLVPTVLFFTSV